MGGNESTGSSRAHPRSGEPGPTRWVVSAETTGCDHPRGSLEPLGGDGLNGYYRCDRCGAGVVVQDESWYGV